jgi:hypothetical protein
LKTPFKLVPNGVSTDTVRSLEYLLDEARKGNVIGVAYAAMFRKRSYVVNMTGEAHRSPTFARGMVATLNDHLGERIRNEA